MIGPKKKIEGNKIFAETKRLINYDDKLEEDFINGVNSKSVGHIIKAT